MVEVSVMLDACDILFKEMKYLIKRNETTEKLILISDKCVGCQLCVTVCSAQAISSGKSVKK